MSDNERAKEQARAQLDSIILAVNRVKHCQTCDFEASGEDCELTDQEILEGLGLYYKEGATATEEEREQYHDEDDARRAIDEDPLEVSVRSDWHSPGEGEDVEYLILLCTGGPAVRITGDLGEHNQPDTAQIQYQDWFTYWERLYTTEEEDEVLLEYAQAFYFGD